MLNIRILIMKNVGGVGVDASRVICGIGYGIYCGTILIV